MYKQTLMMTAALLLLLPISAAAQDDEEYIYVTYFECDPSMEWLADGVFEMVQKPAYEKAVADGALNNYGWLVHHTGGHWRRALWRSADSVDALMASFDVLAANTDSSMSDAGAQFSKICNRHEDYIWQASGGSGAVPEEAPEEGVGISVYFRCDQNREERADNWSSLFTARSAIIQAMTDGEASEAGEEFTDICGDHEDYLWVMP